MAGPPIYSWPLGGRHRVAFIDTLATPTPTPTNTYVQEDGVTEYVTEDGSQPYVPEI